MRFNPAAKVVAHHGNIKSQEFGVEYFRSFNIVMNALDNVSARRYAFERHDIVWTPTHALALSGT